MFSRRVTKRDDFRHAQRHFLIAHYQTCHIYCREQKSLTSAQRLRFRCFSMASWCVATGARVIAASIDHFLVAGREHGGQERGVLLNSARWVLRQRSSLTLHCPRVARPPTQRRSLRGALWSADEPHVRVQTIIGIYCCKRRSTVIMRPCLGSSTSLCSAKRTTLIRCASKWGS